MEEREHKRQKKEVDLSAQHHASSAVATLRGLANTLERDGGDFDTYMTGKTLQSFEKLLADTLGLPAARYFVTGTAAQQAALKAHTVGEGLMNRRPVVCLHPTSHLVFLDCLRDGTSQDDAFAGEAAKHLPEFDVRRFGTMSRSPTLEDLSTAIEKEKPEVVVLELPQRMNGGATIPWEDLKSVSKLCRSMGIKLHCDGARLWEIQPYYGVPLAEISALFDSVYVSFYKGLGGLAGAMLLGSEGFVEHSTTWLKRTGGNVFTRGPLPLHCEAQFRRYILDDAQTFTRRWEKMKRLVKAIQKVAGHSESPWSDVDILRFEPRVPQSAMVHGYLKGDADALEQIHAVVQRENGVKLWNRLRGRGHPQDDGANWCYFEWSIGPGNLDVDERDAAPAWAKFFRLLWKQEKEA